MHAQMEAIYDAVDIPRSNDLCSITQRFVSSGQSIQLMNTHDFGTRQTHMP